MSGEAIPIMCEPLDRLLGGGIERGVITLFYGEGGSGKTNICLQMARNLAAAGGKVIYIDTEGVSVERLRQMSGDDFETVMENIYFYHPYSFSDQEKNVASGIRLAKKKGAGLIVLDSATMHVRLTIDDENRHEKKSLSPQLSKLMTFAREEDVPVILTSQVYTDGSTGEYRALGGHALYHAAKTIVRLDRTTPGRRRAVLIKHRHMPEMTTAEFAITERGVE